MHKFLFYNKYIICLYMFRALCAHHHNFKMVLYSIWYHHILYVAVRCSKSVYGTATYMCDDTRCYII